MDFSNCKIRSAYWPDKYVGYAKDRSSYDVSTRDDPGLSRTFRIDNHHDEAHGRLVWTIYALETQRPNGPQGHPDFYMSWAYGALALIAPPGEGVRLGGVSLDGPRVGLYPPEVAQWVAHMGSEGGVVFYTLEAMTQPYSYLTHGLNNWWPDNKLPLGLCNQDAPVPPMDFRWYVEENVQLAGAKTLTAAAADA